MVLLISQAVVATEAAEVRAVASAEGVDVSTSRKSAAVVVITALANVGSIALSVSSSGDWEKAIS